MSGKIKQRDITDCGAACLASVAAHYGMKMPVARIRQLACTDKKGTNILGMVEAAKKMGFEAKGVRGKPESLLLIPKPAIAHVTLPSGLQHFVVIVAATKRTIEIMDPADGMLHRKTHEAFNALWTGVLVLMLPNHGFSGKDTTSSNTQRFWRLIKPHGKVILQAFTGAVIFAVLGLASAVYVGKIVDHVIPTGNHNLMNLLGIAMLITVLFRTAIHAFQMLFVMKTGQKIDATLILGYYKHILRLPQSFFDQMRVGELISRINDAVKVRLFINDIAMNLVINVLILVVSFLLMFAYYWKLAIIMLAVVPFYAGIYAISNRLNKRVQRKVMERAADMESQLVESLSAASTIKRYNLEGTTNIKMEARFVGLLEEVYKSGLNGIFSSSASSLVTQAFSVVLLWIGTSFVLRLSLSPGELLSFYALMGYFTGPVAGIIGFNRSLQDALIASDRLFEIFDLHTEETDGSIDMSPGHVADIRFEDVTFRYGTRARLFESLNLEIKAGSLTAIAGDSGSGKSTLASLLQKIYPLENGKIYIGNLPQNMFSVNSLRKRIVSVPQKIDLFAGTVVENIAIGAFHPDMDRLLHVCRQVGIDTFIDQLPNGLQTHLGENGASVSGGQKQRIAIARALYAKPEVLILDEATSSLDSHAERCVADVMKALCRDGKTVIVIAHRLSTILNADTVIVLDGGKVVQQGTPRELANQQGKFRDLFMTNDSCVN